MPISKRKAHLNKVYAARKKAENDFQETTEITSNKEGPKYQKRPYKETPVEIVEERTRSGTQKCDRSQFTNQDFAMMYDAKSLRKLLLLLFCPGCKKQNCLNFLATSVQGLCSFFQVFCVLCPFETQTLRSSEQDLSLKSALAIKALGIQKSQVQRLFQLIGTGFLSPSVNNPGGQKVRSVNFFSNYFDKTFDIICVSIVEKSLLR